MTLKISYSSVQQYLSCPRKWYFHRIERLRSPKLGSALFFGNALDDAFSRMLLDKKPELSESEIAGLEFSPEETFSLKMLEAKNEAGQIIQLAQSNLADYYASDFSSELFTPEIVQLVAKMDQSFNTLPKIVKFHEDCKYNLNFKNKDRRKLTNDEFVLYNYINWLSLNEKGKLMLEAYKRDIIPQISTVYSIQKEIAIPNEFGDVISGKIDLTASFTDKPEVPYICDNKTSSKPYSDDSVLESEQLATYAEAEKNFNGAYIVVQKQLYKKEPKIHTQVIKSTIPEQLLQKTFQIYENVVHSISAAGSDIENYPKNESSCFAFGKMCSYYSICKHNNKDYLIDCKKPKDVE